MIRMMDALCIEFVEIPKERNACCTIRIMDERIFRKKCATLQKFAS